MITLSNIDIFALILAFGLSLTLITTTAVRNMQLYKDNTNLRRTIRIMKMAQAKREDTYNPWEINPDHEYESRHPGK